MSIDDKVKKKKLVRIDKKDCMSDIYQLLKSYNSDIQKLVDDKTKIISFLNESQMYENLGFRVKYYYDKSNDSYTFSYEDKQKAGFKK